MAWCEFEVIDPTKVGSFLTDQQLFSLVGDGASEWHKLVNGIVGEPIEVREHNQLI